ncbi:hypothetical protein KSP40_PGU001776 [Platanthera guangdongensis]|uniref:Uncharacterized protein n=1 Tax=Platanthera guangdongensis TaxID=2320717 RepID=A0ABR2MPX7_9ASPA
MTNVKQLQGEFQVTNGYGPDKAKFAMTARSLIKFCSKAVATFHTISSCKRQQTLTILASPSSTPFLEICRSLCDSAESIGHQQSPCGEVAAVNDGISDGSGGSPIRRNAKFAPM